MRKHSTRKPRPVRIPVTRGLLDDFGRELHYSLMKADVGHFSTVEFDKIGGCINVIYGALDLKPPRDKTLLVAIEGAMRAMNECAKRGDRSGIWTLTLTERAAVSAGVKKAEEAAHAGRDDAVPGHETGRSDAGRRKEGSMSEQCTEQRFLKDVETHKMKILRDDGTNRHIQFKREGTRCYQFDLITWPGYLCYTGDMGTYVFQRLNDMFEFFRTDRNDFNFNKGGLSINPGYWGEKLEAVDKCDGFKEFSLDKFRENIRSYLEHDEHDEELLAEVESELLDVHFGNGYEAYQAVYDFHHEGFSFTDFFEYDSEAYSFRFMWCCYALAWGVKKYDEAKSAPCQHVVIVADQCAKCGAEA